MRSHDELTEKIKKYARQLKDGVKVGHVLRRLHGMAMTVELLQSTGIGKAVNALRDHEEVGDLARDIVQSWKDVAKKSGLSEGPSAPAAPSSPKKKNGELEKKRKSETDEGCKSSAKKPKMSAFDQALADAVAEKTAAERVRKPKKEYSDSYRPLKPFDLEALTSTSVSALVRPSAAPTAPAFDVTEQFRPRNQLTKIFAGRKKTGTAQEVPKLFDLCIKVIGSNLNEIESTGNIPFFVLKPALVGASAAQLLNIERKNPYLEEDSDELWKILVEKHHPNGQRMKREGYRRMFLRLEAENENRLKMLTKRIGEKKDNAEKEQKGARMMTEEKAPPGVRRRQMKNGTYSAGREALSAHQVSQARKEIFNTGSKAALVSLPSGVRNLTSTLGSSSGEKKREPAKKGALMLKTMKMLGVRR